MFTGSAMEFEISVVSKHITRRKGTTILSVAAIALAVAISITFVSIQNGFQDFIFDIVFKNLPHATVSPPEGEDFIHLYRNIVDRAWAIQGVIGVSPTLSAAATFAYKDNVENVLMTGGIPSEADKISGLSEDMVKGDFYSVLGGNRVIIGQALADKLDVRVGDTVQASFPDAKTLNLVVSGIFDTGYDPVDESITFVSLDTARDFVGEGDVVTAVEIKLQDPFQAEAVARELSSYGYEAKGWEELYPEIVRTLVFERTQNFITLMLLMVIAAFGIASIMNMLVLEKTREIGMLMAMGATGSNIRRLFLLESASLGLIGSLVGSVLGLILSLAIRGIEVPSAVGEPIGLPVVINPQDFAFYIVLSVVLSMAAGTYPAHQASKLDPVEALKG